MGTYTVAPGGQAHPIYMGTRDGPVRVVSTGGQPIFVSERQIYGSSSRSSLGVPSSQLTTEYYFPWYDGMTMSTALSLGAPDVNAGDASVDVYIGGVYQNTYTCASRRPGERHISRCLQRCGGCEKHAKHRGKRTAGLWEELCRRRWPLRRTS